MFVTLELSTRWFDFDDSFLIFLLYIFFLKVCSSIVVYFKLVQLWTQFVLLKFLIIYISNIVILKLEALVIYQIINIKISHYSFYHSTLLIHYNSLKQKNHINQLKSCYLVQTITQRKPTRSGQLQIFIYQLSRLNDNTQKPLNKELPSTFVFHKIGETLVSNEICQFIIYWSCFSSNELQFLCGNNPLSWFIVFASICGF